MLQVPRSTIIEAAPLHPVTGWILDPFGPPRMIFGMQPVNFPILKMEYSIYTMARTNYSNLTYSKLCNSYQKHIVLLRYHLSLQQHWRLNTQTTIKIGRSLHCAFSIACNYNFGAYGKLSGYNPSLHACNLKNVHAKDHVLVS